MKRRSIHIVVVYPMANVQSSTRPSWSGIQPARWVCKQPAQSCCNELPSTPREAPLSAHRHQRPSITETTNQGDALKSHCSTRVTAHSPVSVTLGLGNVRQARTLLALCVAQHAGVARAAVARLADADALVAESACNSLRREDGCK